MASIDSNTVVVAPPEEPKGSFGSPRTRTNSSSSSSSSTSSSKNKNKRGSSSTKDPREVSAETVEQRYLKQRIKDRPQHNPNLPMDVQVKSIILKSMSIASEDDGSGIEDFERNEEKKRQEVAVAKLNESESQNSLLMEKSSPRLNLSNLQELNAPYNSAIGATRKRFDSMDSRKFGSDSQDSGRGEALTDVKSKAEYKAAKKIEWLENYMILCEKKNVPLDSPELVKSKEILSKFKSATKKAAMIPVTTVASGVEGSMASGVVINSMPERRTSEKCAEIRPFPDPTQQVASDEVLTLQKQLEDARKEIDKLRLERALVHAQKEINKLKTEIIYGREDENADYNIDNIFPEKGSHSPLPNPQPIPSVAADVTTSNVQASSPLPGLSSTKTPIKVTDPDGVTIGNTPPADTSPAPSVKKEKRNTTRLSTRMSKIGLGSKGGGPSKWSIVAKELATNGSESLVEEDEIEAYREEKRKKKKKKKFMEEIEDFIPSISNNRNEVNPLIKKQLQSFEFLNFLDSLDGLDGNAPQMPSL